ncbi:MAG: hypothetical protein RL417_1638 [Pseudomonadota bacterium]|jgi:TrmH family RNA methyltransferase
MTVHSIRDRFHVVLVEPGESRNIGSVARAMKNLGFAHLHLVAPPHYDRARAAMTACWADDILDAAAIHPTLADALSNFEQVIAFSGREGKNRGAPLDLLEWGESLAAAPPDRTALVFGPEDNGLRQEHIELCRLVLRIPSSVECPSFNLAQAVILALFEIARRDLPAAPPSGGERVPAVWNDYFQLDRLLDRVMDLSGFVRVGTPEPVPGLVKNLFRRVDLDKREMGILLGLFGRLDRVLTRQGGEPSGGDPSEQR